MGSLYSGGVFAHPLYHHLVTDPGIIDPLDIGLADISLDGRAVFPAWAGSGLGLGRGRSCGSRGISHGSELRMRPFYDWPNPVHPSTILNETQRSTHTYVIGQPGTGKSRALESWIRQDISLGHGVGVIDPHGDLFNHMVAFLATQPQTWERVILLDPCHPLWTLTFNPLASIEGLSPERVSLFMTDIVVKIWGIDSITAPRLVWLLTNSFLALSLLKLSLLDLPRFLSDSDYREGLLPRLGHASIQAYFLHEFPQTPSAVHQWITPVLNKIGNLIFDPDMRLMFSGKPRFNFRQVLDNRLIFLANIPKGILGEGISALLGAFIVAQIQKAALSRSDTIKREPFYLYLDEFQNYTTDNIEDILCESRKYALSLTLAHQFLDQIPPQLRSAVLNTTGTIACFRVGYHDAVHLAKDIFPASDFMASAKHELKMKHAGRLPFLSLEDHQEELGWEGLAKLLTQLPERHFWVHSRSWENPVRQKAFYIPDPPTTPDFKSKVEDLYDAAGRRYGRLKSDAQKEASQNNTYAPRDSGNNPYSNETETGDAPFWGL